MSDVEFCDTNVFEVFLDQGLSISRRAPAWGPAAGKLPQCRRGSSDAPNYLVPKA